MDRRCVSAAYGALSVSGVRACEYVREREREGECRRVQVNECIRHVMLGVRDVHSSVYTKESLTVQYHPNIFIFHVKIILITYYSTLSA